MGEKCKACRQFSQYDLIGGYCDVDCMKAQKEYLEDELRDLERLIDESNQ